MTGGSQPSKSSSLLSRNRIIKELDAKLSVLSKQYQKLERTCIEKAEGLNELEEHISIIQKEHQDLELIVIREEQRVLSIQDTIEELGSSSRCYWPIRMS